MNDFGEGRRIVGDSGVNAFLMRVYGIMGIAVLISALSAYLFAVYFPQLDTGFSGLAVIIIWFVVALVLQVIANTNAVLGFIGLLIFSVLTGITFSDIFAIFNLGQIWAALVSAASLFLVMSLIGFTTHKDLSRLGTQMFAALIALIIAMIISLFFTNTILEMIINVAGVIIFSIMSMTDTQNLTVMYEENAGAVNINGLAINGALDLFLDFINLFSFILDILGMSSNNR